MRPKGKNNISNVKRPKRRSTYLIFSMAFTTTERPTPSDLDVDAEAPFFTGCGLEVTFVVRARLTGRGGGDGEGAGDTWARERTGLAGALPSKCQGTSKYKIKSENTHPATTAAYDGEPGLEAMGGRTGFVGDFEDLLMGAALRLTGYSAEKTIIQANQTHALALEVCVLTHPDWRWLGLLHIKRVSISSIKSAINTYTSEGGAPTGERGANVRELSPNSAQSMSSSSWSVLAASRSFLAGLQVSTAGLWGVSWTQGKRIQETYGSSSLEIVTMDGDFLTGFFGALREQTRAIRNQQKPTKARTYTFLEVDLVALDKQQNGRSDIGTEEQYKSPTRHSLQQPSWEAWRMNW